jgi:hypothetical protein
VERASVGVASDGAGVDAGARPAAGGDGGARARTTSRAAALWLKHFAGALFKSIFPKKLNRTGPSDEYQSCRSSYQQYFLQRLYRGFLPRFEVISMPKVNVSLFWQTVKTALQLVFQAFPLKI